MTGSEEKAASRVCEIDMIIRSDRGGTRCGRPIYNAPVGVDREPVCLMHSKDPNKNNEDFQAEFEHILSEAEQKRAAADFTRFIFPASDYSGRTFAPVCWFFFATFTQDVHFSWATFNLVASFSHATFIQNADFSRATFS
jgi:hypothetical protein